jgi:hypothetical protein
MLPAAAVATALLLVETVSAYVSGSAAFLLRSRNPQVSRCSERVRALFAGGRLRIALARGASHTLGRTRFASDTLCVLTHTDGPEPCVQTSTCT